MEIYDHIHNCWLPLTSSPPHSLKSLTSGEKCKLNCPTAYASASDSWTMMENHSAQQAVLSSVSLYVIQPINYKQKEKKEVSKGVLDQSLLNITLTYNMQLLIQLKFSPSLISLENGIWRKMPLSACTDVKRKFEITSLDSDTIFVEKDEENPHQHRTKLQSEREDWARESFLREMPENIL
jgi:hypothetical protein